jgi:hypothetical protein
VPFGLLKREDVPSEGTEGHGVFRDPAKGIAWASSGGAAVLLMNDLYPQFARLGQFLPAR